MPYRFTREASLVTPTAAGDHRRRYGDDGGEHGPSDAPFAALKAETTAKDPPPIIPSLADPSGNTALR